MENLLVYEHPLNERIRTLLRLENLFSRLQHYSASTEVMDTRLSINLLIDLNELLKLSDIRFDLPQELERCQTVLRALEGNPGVDSYKLKRVLSDINKHIAVLKDKTCQPGSTLDKDELITSTRHKGVVAGGACNFDLPAYHYWLNKPTLARQKALREWQEDLSIIEQSARMVLKLVRGNATSIKAVAKEGFFQKLLESGASYQLLRIFVSRELKCFPEISGGKHRITIRFMEQEETQNRPVQTEKNVEFALHFCT